MHAVLPQAIIQMLHEQVLSPVVERINGVIGYQLLKDKNIAEKKTKKKCGLKIETNNLNMGSNSVLHLTPFQIHLAHVYSTEIGAGRNGRT